MILRSSRSAWRSAAANPQPQAPHLHEDHHPLVKVARDEPKAEKYKLPPLLAKELILISTLTWGGEQPSPCSHSTGRKVLGPSTTTGLSFRISRRLLARHNQSFNTLSRPFSSHLTDQNAGLNSLLKIKPRIRAFKHPRIWKTVFKGQRVLQRSSCPYTKRGSDRFSCKEELCTTYPIFGIWISQVLR